VDRVQDPQTPRQLAQFVDHDIMNRHVRRRPFPGGFIIRPAAAQIPYAQRLVPVIQRARTMPHEDQWVGQVHASLKQAAAAGGGIQNGRVKRRTVELRKLVGRRDPNNRQHLHRETRILREPRELLLDSPRLFLSRCVRLHTTPGLVGGLRTRLGNAVHQDGLHTQRPRRHGIRSIGVPEIPRPRGLRAFSARRHGRQTGHCRHGRARAEKRSPIHVRATTFAHAAILPDDPEVQRAKTFRQPVYR